MSQRASGSQPVRKVDEKIMELFQNLNNGIACYEARDYRSAVDYFSREIEIDSECATAYQHRGFALLRDSRFADALTDFLKAITLNRFLPDAYVGHNLCQIALGKSAQCFLWPESFEYMNQELIAEFEAKLRIAQQL
jgi:tetratricopeptide (TPR) repeat protein